MEFLALHVLSLGDTCVLCW